MKPFVIDLETSINNEQIGNFKASPFYKDNKIVAVGTKYSSDNIVTLLGPIAIYPPNWGESILVGHNLKFDLLYLMRAPSWRKWLETGYIWDTMLAEYVITGQEHQYASLNDLSLKYGGTQKNDKIKEYWDNGIKTEDIPPGELLLYLEHDVMNTYTVLLGQIQEVKRRNLWDLLAVEFDALLATTEMEWNGLYVDKDALEVGTENSAHALKLCTNVLAGLLRDYTGYNLNPSSNHHISAFLFGGHIKEKVAHFCLEDGTYKPKLHVPHERAPIGTIRYKTGERKGQPKTKLIEVSSKVTGLGLKPEKEWETKFPGVYQVGDDIIKKLKSSYPEYDSILGHILAYREISKDYNTYFLGYGKLVWPHDSCIHGTISHVGTNTGRLSSSNPNTQNLSNGGE